MERVFNEKNYRAYLENHYDVMADKFNYKKRKDLVDQYSKEELQKIVDDTKEFAIYIMKELEKTELSLIDSVFMKTQIWDEAEIDTGLYGGSPADVLYNPDGFQEDVYVSNSLLNSFFMDKVYTNYKEEECYFEDEDDKKVILVPYLNVVMKKEKFKDYKKYLEEKGKVKTKK